jgi:hypothetical protein
MLADLVSAFDISDELAGTVRTRVWADAAFNPNTSTLDPTDAYLTFTYNITLDNLPPNTEALARLGLPGWGGWLADASQSGVGEAAKTADRTPGTGDIIGFNFSPDSTFFGGEVSATLILASNADQYVRGLYGVQSGLVDEGDTYVPGAVPVPDGASTLILLGLACVALNRVSPKKSQA